MHFHSSFVARLSKILRGSSVDICCNALSSVSVKVPSSPIGYRKNSTRANLQNSEVIDRKEMQNTNVRMALHSVFQSNNYMVEKSLQDCEQYASGKWNSSIKVDVVSLHAQPCVLIAYGNKCYYVNPSTGFIEALFNLGKTPPMNTVLFTRCNFQSALGVLPSLLNSQQTQFNQLDVFGPPGTQNVFTTLMPFLRSVKASERWKSSLLFHETEETGIITISKKNVNVKMINYYSKKSHCYITVGYVFESRIMKGSPRSAGRDNLRLSWKDFTTVESYIKYLKTCLECFEEASNEEVNLQICVLDCPNQSCLDELRTDMSSLLCGLSKVLLCIHLTPKSLYYSEDYINYCKKLGNCRHVSVHDMLSSSNIPDRFQHFRGLLHTLHPSFFPLYSNRIALDTLQKEMIQASSIKKTSFLDIQPETVKKVNYFFAKNECEKMLEFLSDLDDLPLAAHFPSRTLFPSLVVLGSGASTLSHSRSQPCYLLQVDDLHSILLDCGPDTLSQMIKHYGLDLAKDMFSTVRAVVLTHKHSDHWCGFLNVLTQLREEREGKLFVFLPLSTKIFFLQHCIDNSFHNIDFVTIEDFHKNSIKFHKSLSNWLNVKSLCFVPVDHGPPTYGVVVELVCNKKIVYSSDTLPGCKALIEAGADADLLIHDCLYVDEADKNMANFRMHSTMRGAIATAKHMNAKNLMLTHFASRYTYLPVDVSGVDELYDGKIVVALDHLELPLLKIEEYVEFLKVLSRVFKNSDDKSNVVYKPSTINELSNLYEKVRTITSA